MSVEAGSEALARRLQEVVEMMAAGQHKAAGVVCTELVKAHPDNAEAYALLAETYAARQMWREATEWYERAMQLGAESDVSRRLEEARRQGAAHELEAHSDASRAQSGSAPTRLWWTFGAAGAATLLALAIALSVFLHPSAPPASPQPSATLSSARSVRGALPRTSPRRESRRSAPATTSSDATGRQSRLTSAREMIGPMSDRDYETARTLGSLSWPDGTPMSNAVAVVIDPTGYAMISFQIPSALQVEKLSAAVLRQSYALATTALRAEAGITLLTVRALATITLADDQERTVVVYRANTSRTAIESWTKLRREPTLEELWSRAFATSWWNPGVRTDRLE